MKNLKEIVETRTIKTNVLSTLKKQDSTLQTLEVLAAENKRFRNHWLWQRLQCTPEEFFHNFKKQFHDNIAQTQEWKDALAQAQAEIKAQLQLQAMKQTRSKPTFLHYGALQV